MQEDYLTKIRSVYNQFTKAEKKIADFVLKDPEKVLFLSISELAKSSNVGDTSVFRFAKTLEAKGYQDFKMKLSLSLRDESVNMKDGLVSPSDTVEELISKVLNENISAIEETFSLIDPDILEKAVDLLSGSQRITFFGLGTSMLTAMKAMNKFLRIEPKVTCHMDVKEQLISASMLNENDTAVIFSYSGSTPDTVRIAEEAKKTHARIILITRFQKSPLTEFADLIILTGASESPLKSGSLSAEISQLFVVDILYSEYFRKNYEKCLERWRKSEKL